MGDRIFGLLTVDPAVAAIVDTRVYPSVLPQDVEHPAIAYTLITNGAINTLNGPSALRRAGVQFDCYARAYDDSQLVADAVEDVFAALQAPIFPRRDIYEDDTQLHRCSFDVGHWSSEDR